MAQSVHWWSWSCDLYACITWMALKQSELVVLHNENINNIHYKLGLNIYIGSYIIVLVIACV